MRSDIDFDRLADFVGGALDGTPDAEAVRELVATDDRWARAYTELVAADAAVRSDLSAYGAAPATIPADVAGRLDDALRTAPRLTVVGGSGAPVRRRPRRWQKVALGLSAAAAVVVCGAGAVNLLPQIGVPTTSSDDAGGSDNGLAQSEPDKAAGAPGAGGPRTLSSGTDYDPRSLAGLGAAAAGAAEAVPGAQPTRADQGRNAEVPAELRRLLQPSALAACTTAIVSEYGGAIELVDYARFEGRPALVVLLKGARPARTGRWVVVVGPDCGIGGAIQDERYNGPVG